MEGRPCPGAGGVLGFNPSWGAREQQSSVGRGSIVPCLPRGAEHRPRNDGGWGPSLHQTSPPAAWGHMPRCALQDGGPLGAGSREQGCVAGPACTGALMPLFHQESVQLCGRAVWALRSSSTFLSIAPARI